MLVQNAQISIDKYQYVLLLPKKVYQYVLLLISRKVIVGVFCSHKCISYILTLDVNQTLMKCTFYNSIPLWLKDSTMSTRVNKFIVSVFVYYVRLQPISLAQQLNVTETHGHLFVWIPPCSPGIGTCIQHLDFFFWF